MLNKVRGYKLNLEYEPSGVTFLKVERSSRKGSAGNVRKPEGSEETFNMSSLKKQKLRLPGFIS